MKRVGVLRVVTSNDRDFLEKHQRLIQVAHPEFTLETRCLPDQPNGIHDAATLAHALPQIEALAREWYQSLDGLIVSCAADPGLDRLKAILPIPVIGAGEACCREAMMKGVKVGAIGIQADAPPVFYQHLGERLVRYCQPEGIECTHDIHSEAGRREIIQAVKALEAGGVEVVALACTGMATTDVVAMVAPYADLPVVNPVLAAGEAMAQCLAGQEEP